MTLLFLMLLLVAPYLMLTLLGRWIPRMKMAPSKRAKVGLSLFFVVTALAHFNTTEEMAEMIPSSVPYRAELSYVTGILELLGAIGVWIQHFERLMGFLIVVMLIGLLPANYACAYV